MDGADREYKTTLVLVVVLEVVAVAVAVVAVWRRWLCGVVWCGGVPLAVLVGSCGERGLCECARARVRLISQSVAIGHIKCTLARMRAHIYSNVVRGSLCAWCERRRR